MMTQIQKDNRGRPRKFEENHVVEMCIPLFLQQGYFGVSITDILGLTGLEKSSFYLAFGDKEAFYCKVLERYHATALYRMKSILESQTDFTKAFDELVDFLLNICTENDFNYGCLTANAATEINKKQVKIYNTVKQLRGEMIDLYASRLSQGIDDGQVVKTLNSRNAAHFLKSSLDGMVLHARGVRDAQSSQSLSVFIKQSINSWTLSN